MKLVFLAAAAAVALSGCATSGGLTPEQMTQFNTLVKTAHDAGCGGSFGLHGGASTGQLGGQANLSVNIDAQCPTAAPPPATVTAPPVPVSTTPG